MKRLGPRARMCILLLAVATTAATGAVGSPAIVGVRRVPAMLGGLRFARYLGPAPARERHTIGVSLQRPNLEGEKALFEELYNPSSPLFGQYLTPAEFAKQFGVPRSWTNAVVGWLRSSHLSVENIGDGYITATGSIDALQKTFDVRIGRYDAGGIGFIANDAPPAVPAMLPITAVVGLDTLHRFWLPSQQANRAGVDTKAAPPPGVLPADELIHPKNLNQIYDMPSSNLGQGQTMGVFGAGATDTTITNLRVFEANQGLPKVPVRLVRTEPGDDAAYGDNSGNGEWFIDTQASTGVAPNVARLDLYFSRSLFDADILASFESWAGDPNGPRQMNASFGECEQGPTNPVTGPLAQLPFGSGLGNELELGAEPILLKATLEGRTLFSSTGDTGSGCPEVVVPILGAGNGIVIQPVPGVGYPAASPYVVAVGGTVLTSNGGKSRASEVAWTFTGGGSSGYIPEPSYQAGVAAVNHPCQSHPDGTPYTSVTTCRGVPDVSALSGNIFGNGYAIYSDGSPSGSGGTSLSSPLTMGMWARLQAASSLRKGLGFANFIFYRYPSDFYDVTKAESPIGNGAYQPGPGWDYTTGLGVPDVAKLLKDIDHTLAARKRTLAVPQPSAAPTCVALMTSPAGNASNPYASQLGNTPTLDITQATLTVHAGSIVATITGPGLAAAPTPGATGGSGFRTFWWSAGHEYYLQAQIDSKGGVTYGAGTTDDGPVVKTPRASGSFSAGALRISVPADDVGGVRIGSRLSYPFAESYFVIGAPDAGSGSLVSIPVTVDAAAAPSTAKASAGQYVAVGRRCR